MEVGKRLNECMKEEEKKSLWIKKVSHVPKLPGRTPKNTKPMNAAVSFL